MQSRLLMSIVTVIFGTIATSVNAADKPKSKHKKPPVTEDTGEATAPSSGQSVGESVRATRKIGVDADYSVAADFMLKYGGSVSYNDSSRLSLGFTALTGSDSMSENSGDGSGKVSATLSGLAAYGYGRYFFGNTFNLSAGLGIRTATMTYKIEVPTAGITLNGKVDIQSIVLPLYIGNRWSFADSGFTIGCDWLGYMVAVSGSAKSSLDGNLDNVTIKSLNDEMLDLSNSLAHKSSVILLLTSVGWAF